MLSTDFLPQNMSVNLHSTSKLRMWYVRTKTFIYYRQIIYFHSFINCTSFRNFNSVCSSTLYATLRILTHTLKAKPWSVLSDILSTLQNDTRHFTWFSPFTAWGPHTWLIKVRASTQRSVRFVPSLKEYKYTHVHLFNLYYNAVKEVLKLPSFTDGKKS